MAREHGTNVLTIAQVSSQLLAGQRDTISLSCLKSGVNPIILLLQ